MRIQQLLLLHREIANWQGNKIKLNLGKAGVQECPPKCSKKEILLACYELESK